MGDKTLAAGSSAIKNTYSTCHKSKLSSAKHVKTRLLTAKTIEVFSNSVYAKKITYQVILKGKSPCQVMILALP
jgi:UDP-glucose 6-dehydrogenase